MLRIQLILDDLLIPTMGDNGTPLSYKVDDHVMITSNTRTYSTKQ
jgi:hypothetical protein